MAMSDVGVSVRVGAVAGKGWNKAAVIGQWAGMARRNVLIRS